AAAGGAEPVAANRATAGRSSAGGGGVPAAADHELRVRGRQGLQRLLSRLPGAAEHGAGAVGAIGAGRCNAADAGEWAGAAGDRSAGRYVRREVEQSESSRL